MTSSGVDEGRVVGGRFEIRERLGAGGEAEVVRAHDLELDLDVVLKTRPIGDGDDLDRMRREAGLLMRVVGHRGLPVVRSDLVEDGRYYMISDHVDGRDLHDIVKAQEGSALPLSDVLDLIDQIAEALDHLHTQQPAVVHGDVKPENVVVTADGRAVVVDFGAAMRVGDDRERFGTPGFSAPEVLSGDSLSATADIYSLAALAVFLLTGIVPKLGTAWPTAMADGELGRLERTLRRGLTWDPLGRPWSATDLARSLREAASMDVPSGTVTLMLLTPRSGATPKSVSSVLPMLEAAGGRSIESVRLPSGCALLVFSRAGDAAAAAFSLGDLDLPRLTLHAGDLGGWHGATLQYLVNEAIELSNGTPESEVSCSPTVQMLLGADEAFAFRRVSANQVELRQTSIGTEQAVESPDAPSLTSARASAWIAARRTTPLAGRETELRHGLAEIDRGRAEAHAALLVVNGETGLGKTRLLAEFADRALESGELVLVGRCTESGGAFEALLDALGEELFPFEAGQLERDEEGWIDRRRFFGRITSALGETGRAVTLVLDDVQWIDGSSLALLTQLLDDVGPLLAVLVGSRPSTDRNILDALTQRRGTAVIGLQPLAADELSQMAHDLDVDLTEESLDGLHALTGGSPFFGLQLLRQFRAASHVDFGSGDVPAGVREWIMQRVGPLGDEAVNVLAAAAVTGRAFEIMMLADVVGSTPLEVLGHLEAAVDEGLLTDGSRPGEFSFVHAIVESTLADSLSPTRRGLVHATVARRLEENGNGLENLEAALHHWIAAEGLGDPIHAGEIAVEVGTLTTERLAYERATSIVVRALAVLQTAPATGMRDRIEGRLRLVHARADFVATRSDESIAELYHAADLAEAANDPETLAQAALVASLSRRHGLDDPELLRLLERASAQCPAEPAVLPAMLHIRRSRLLPISVPHEDRVAMAQLGLIDIDKMDPVDRLTVETEVIRACWVPGDAVSRVERTTGIIDEANRRLATSGPSRWTGVLVEALNLRWAAHVQLGDLAAALVDATRAVVVADEAGTTFLLSRAMMGEAMIRATLGELEHAEQLSKDAIGLSDRHNLLLVQMSIAYGIGRDRGQQLELSQLERQMGDLVDSNALFVAAFSLVNAEVGHFDDARRLLAGLDLLEPWPRNWLWLATALATLESAVLVGDRQLVERYEFELVPFRGQWAIAAAELGCWGPVDRVLGLAAASDGRLDDARRLLISARDSSIANRATFWAARCHAGLAGLSGATDSSV